MKRNAWFEILLPLAFVALQAPALDAQQVDTTRLRIQGLQAPVEIITDEWGIAHIYAQNEPDLFFAQGYNAAKDRLFQFEIWRRQATGTVAEILGPRELERDIGMRLFKFRGNLQNELNHYHPRGEQIITSFVNGVNAYIAETERNPDLLPLEFDLLGIKPARWTPEVVVSRHQGLLGNIGYEMSLGRAVAAIGAEKVAEIEYFKPGTPDLQLDPSITLEMLQKDIMGRYNAFRDPIQFRPEDVTARYRGDLETYEQLARALPNERELTAAREHIGSNNWIVSGELTSSGRPIMVNDPHRAITAPSLRYWAHLVAPGWNVIGGGEPVLPGISIGHNEYGAWGLTVFSVDGEDLYVYDVNPANPNQYRYQGAWEDMRVIREEIPVKGQRAHTAELKYTRHGPVLFEDRENNKAYALRAAWLEIGGAPYLASLRMDQAKNWEEFRQALSYSHIPGENMIWADVEGNIGWQPVGISPIRRNFSGLVPVPGDGRYEWDGYLPILELPHILNPEEEYWGNGNDFVVPLDYDKWDAITAGGWNDPYRGDRIREFLGEGRKYTVADMMKLQQDWLSIPARSLTPMLLVLDPQNPRQREAMDRLRGWDYVLDTRSIAAGIYAEWEDRVMENLHAISVPKPAQEYIRNLSMKKAIDWLHSPDERFGSSPTDGRDALLLRSLDQALDNLSRKLGADMEGWMYGQPKYKHSTQMHPLSPAVSPEIRARLEVGTLPRGGNSQTVNNTGGSDNQGSGASFRIIAPIEDWDLTIGTQTPGQSANPDDPNYRNLYPLWATGRYFPAFYTRPKVEAVADNVTLMSPR